MQKYAAEDYRISPEEENKTKNLSFVRTSYTGMFPLVLRLSAALSGSAD